MFALISSLVLAAAPATLTLEIKPSDTIIFVDGKKLGDASKPRTVKLKAGPHEVKLSRDGDTHTDEIVLKPGQNLTWKFEFGEEKKPAKPEADATEEALEHP